MIPSPVDPGPAGWNAILPAAQAPDTQDGDLVTDWLIIGAGFAGLSAAARLLRACPTDRIVIVDATRVGQGPAGRNSGFMIDLPHDLSSESYKGALERDRATTNDNRRAIAFAGELATASGLSKEAFNLSGKINAAAANRAHQHNLDYAKHLQALGEPFDLFDAAKMQKITGTDFYQSGLYTPGTAMIQPAMYVRGVAQHLQNCGVRVIENCPVQNLAKQGDWAAQTASGKITAKRVILAVNGHLQNFGFMTGRLMHVFTYASMTRALTKQEIAKLQGEPIWGATSADPMGSTVRRISGVGGDRIVVRNRFTYDPSLQVTQHRIEQVAHDHDRAFTARFPMLSGVSMDYRWGGRLCLSRNNVQVIGEIEPGLYSACCQNGLGTVRGTLAGLLAAEDALGIASPALDRAKADPDPSRLLPSAVMKLGAFARLRFGEYRAGRDM